MSSLINLPDPNSTSAFDMLVTTENFRLAWERVRYFDRPDSRDWIGLKAFAAIRDHNLEMLRQSLLNRTFEPSYPEIRYMPKPSQTLRPMAILPTKDRIVFQAIANVIAEKGRATLSIVSNRQSFANVLQEPGIVPMFISWEYQHPRFQYAFRSLIEQGNNWIAETDIAAFYETVDHCRLLRLLLDGGFVDETVREYLQSYLPIWASVSSGNPASKGIPQGCLSSDLLANLFLFELDEKLASQECYYLRYVDDIRLIANTLVSANCLPVLGKADCPERCSGCQNLNNVGKIVPNSGQNRLSAAFGPPMGLNPFG